MTSLVIEAEAVLKAADVWVGAQEAVLAAKQVGMRTKAAKEILDIAGSRLVVAVMHWRAKRGAS
jgi:hypothetical protein